MATKQTAIRLPVGILEAIDARRDADNDRTAIIISLLTCALTGEYIKPKENTAQIIGKLTKTVKSLETAIDELSFQIKKQTRINTQVGTYRIAESQIVSERNNSVNDNTTDFDDDEDLAIEQVIPDDEDFSDDDEDIDNEGSDYVEDIEPQSEPEPTQFTHQEFIERLGCTIPSGVVVVLNDGDVCELAIVSRDAVVAIDPRSKREKRLSIGEISHYQVAISHDV